MFKRYYKLVLALLFFFLFIVVGILSFEGFFGLDEFLNEKISLEDESLESFISYLNSILIFLFFCFFVFILCFYKKFKECFFMIGALVLGYFLKQVFSFFIMRERPGVDALINPLTSYSFPSGHVVLSTILFSFIIYSFLDDIKKYFFQVMLIFICSFFLLFLGASRMYIGIHWFTDVLGGYFLGLSTVFFVFWLMEYYESGFLERIKSLPYRR